MRGTTNKEQILQHVVYILHIWPFTIFIHFVLEKTKLLCCRLRRLISGPYRIDNHHQIVKNRYLHVDKLFWTKGLAIGDGSFFFPPFVCFSYSFEGSLRFFCVSSNKLHNTSEISEGCRMGEILLQNPPPRLLYLLPTYLDENEKIFSDWIP